MKNQLFDIVESYIICQDSKIHHHQIKFDLFYLPPKHNFENLI